MCRTLLAESHKLRSRAIGRRTYPRFSFREPVLFILKAIVLIVRGEALHPFQNVVVRKDILVDAVVIASGVTMLLNVHGPEINLLPPLLLLAYLTLRTIIRQLLK